MPSRKQRRRREKERRHDWEYVYVDEEGRELDPEDVDEDELGANGSEPRRSEKRSTAKATSTKDGSAARSRRAGPVPPAPSWRRAFKRAAIFAPIMFIAILLIGKRLTMAQRILETLYLLALFIPFSYLLDRLIYRRYQRQAGQAPATRASRRRS